MENTANVSGKGCNLNGIIQELAEVPSDEVKSVFMMLYRSGYIDFHPLPASSGSETSPCLSESEITPEMYERGVYLTEKGAQFLAMARQTPANRSQLSSDHSSVYEKAQVLRQKLAD